MESKKCFGCECWILWLDWLFTLSLERVEKLLGRLVDIIHERSICSTGRVRCTAKVDGLVSCNSDFT